MVGSEIMSSTSSVSNGSLEVKGARERWFRFVDERLFRRAACWLYATSILGCFYRGSTNLYFNSTKFFGVLFVS